MGKSNAATTSNVLALPQGSLPKKKAEKVKADIAAYASSPQTVIKDPSKLLRDPKTGVMIAAANDDRGPAERLRHDVVGLEGDNPQMRHARVLTASPLDRMLHRRELAWSRKGDHRRLWNAGDRFRQDYQVAFAEPRVVADLLGVKVDGGGDTIHDARMGAQLRLKKAEKALGWGNYWLLREVCGRDRPPTEVLINHTMKQKGDPMTIFRWCLEWLATHYGY